MISFKDEQKLNSSGRTYGIYLTPHLDKYQAENEIISDIMHDTWNFGNLLKAAGFLVLYMHGPVGIYEDTIVTAGFYEFKGDDIIKEFTESNTQDFIYILFQKFSDGVKMAVIEKAHVVSLRQTRKKSAKKPKKALDKPKKKV